LPRPRTAYQPSLDIAARLAAADPGNSSLEHERQLLAHELGQLIEAMTLRSRRRGPQRTEDTRRQAGEAGP
jgi:hypothetical protein